MLVLELMSANLSVRDSGISPTCQTASADAHEQPGAGRDQVNFDAAELRLPAHQFGVYDWHGGSEVRLSSF
jgi:hypothetical protein